MRYGATPISNSLSDMTDEKRGMCFQEVGRREREGGDIG